jgi:uncharacterized membrane protein
MFPGSHAREWPAKALKNVRASIRSSRAAVHRLIGADLLNLGKLQGLGAPIVSMELALSMASF